MSTLQWPEYINTRQRMDISLFYIIMSKNNNLTLLKRNNMAKNIFLILTN